MICAPRIAVCFLVGKDFNKPVRREIRLRAGIAHEAELAHLVSAALILERFFGLADRGNFWPSIDHAGDNAVIDMARLPRQHFGHGHAFILGFMREHWAVDRVANRVNAVNAGLVMAVRGDLAAFW